jgi:hypothetical protein
MRQRRRAHRVLVWKREGKSPLGRLRNKRGDVELDLQEIWSCVDWIDLARDRERRCPVVNTVMNLPVPYIY